MIRGTDGLDYEDLTARLAGEPAKTRRNDNIRRYRASPGWTEPEIQRYIEGFDKSPSDDFDAAHYLGLCFSAPPPLTE